MVIGQLPNVKVQKTSQGGRVQKLGGGGDFTFQKKMGGDGDQLVMT